MFLVVLTSVILPILLERKLLDDGSYVKFYREFIYPSPFIVNTEHRAPIIVIEPTIIITDATSTLGVEQAKYFAENGAKVLLGCSNPNRGTKLKSQLEELYPKTEFIVQWLALSEMSTVEYFVLEMQKKFSFIDMIIFNSPLAHSTTRQKTDDELELNVQINHFAPAYIIMRLKNMHIIGKRSRVVFVLDPIGNQIKNKSELGMAKYFFPEKSKYDHIDFYLHSQLLPAIYVSTWMFKVRNRGYMVNAIYPERYLYYEKPK
eukprot:UN34071